MRDMLVEERPVGGPPQVADPVVGRWRREWEQSIAAAEAGGNPRLAARRRDYGTYLFAGLDIVLALITQVIFSFLLLVPATIVYLNTGHSLAGPRASTDLQAWLSGAPLFIAVGLAASDAALIAVLWYRRARLRYGWSIYGLGAPLREGFGRAVLLGLALGVLGLILSGLYTNLIHHLLPKVDLGAQDRLLVSPLYHAPGWQVWTEVLAGTFLAPAVEELFFRGYLFRAIATRKSVPLAYAISAAIFAIFHLAGGGNLLPIVPPLFIVGLLLCFAYHRTGNIIADMTAHAVNNGAAFALALLPLIPAH